MAVSSKQSLEDVQDIWSDRWGDAALQVLGRWLMGHGISDRYASLMVDGLWVFYSYRILAATQKRIPLGITASYGVDALKRGATVWIYLPSFETSANGTGSNEVEQGLREMFRREVAQHTGPDIRAQLQFMADRPLADFEPTVRRICRVDRIEFLGTFVDRLESEFEKIMPAQIVGAWLNSPNTLFGGQSPNDLLVDPMNDRPLRDMILSVKHGMIS